MKEMKSSKRGVSKAVLLVIAGVMALALSGCEGGGMSTPAENFAPIPTSSHTEEFYSQPSP